MLTTQNAGEPYFISRDVRMAGYQGCANQNNTSATNLLSPPIPGSDLEKINAIRGYDAGSGSWLPSLPTQLTSLPMNNTDVFYVRFSSPLATPLVNEMLSKNDTIRVDDRMTIADNDYLVINDCDSVDLFRASSGSSNTLINHAAGQNTSAELSQAYTTTAHVAKFESYAYYIAQTGRNNLNGDPIPALFRMDIAGNAVELVEGVENMQITYGLDTDNDGSVDRLSTANVISTDPADNNSWDKVKTVNISLLVNSIDSASDKQQTYTYNGDTVSTPGDTLLRKQWDIHVTLRNRL